MEKNAGKAHCLILPYPIQGHINPMLQFSKRLAQIGIKITVAAREDLAESTKELLGSPLEIIYDGLTKDTRNSISRREYLKTFREFGAKSLSELVEKYSNSSRPFDCIIYDAFLPWGLEVAKRFGLIGAVFFTQSNAVNSIYYHVHKGDIKLPLTEDAEVVLHGLPPLKTSDLPSFLWASGTQPGLRELLVDQFHNIGGADWVLVNTIYELEQEVTDWAANLWPVRTIGPTIPSIYLDKRIIQDKDYDLSIFKPQKHCMAWLNQRPAKSVVYVSFGSMTILEIEQMEELALAMKISGCYFLWVVRSSEEFKLPENFARETTEKGLIVSWCPQLEVLRHDSIGCFVTHCGWNSTLEALLFGVPMVGMPWWSDQTTNAKFVVDVWKMGVRISPDVKTLTKRGEIVRCIKQVMEGERAEEMRRNSRKWKEICRKAFDDGGSSHKNVDEFVRSLIM